MKPSREAIRYTIYIFPGPTQSTFPYHSDSPSVGKQPVSCIVVVRLVLPNFFAPKVWARTGPLEQATVMPMPKATMHKYYRMEARKNDIWFSREGTNMEAKAEALPVQQAPDQNFGLRVAATNAGHHPASCSGINYIYH